MSAWDQRHRGATWWGRDNGVSYMMTGSAVAEPASLREESGDIAATFFDKVGGDLTMALITFELT